MNSKHYKVLRGEHEEKKEKSTFKRNLYLGAMAGILTAGVVATGASAHMGGKNKGRHFGDPQKREQMREAFENKDYQAFRELSEGTKKGEWIDTEEKFMGLIEIRELKMDGKYEEARQKMEELGLEKRWHRRGHEQRSKEAR